MKGLKGGHSGIEIVLERGNANLVLFRLLKMAEKAFGLRLSSVDGGGLRNAIPREARAVVTVPAAEAGRSARPCAISNGPCARSSGASTKA